MPSAVSLKGDAVLAVHVAVYHGADFPPALGLTIEIFEWNNFNGAVLIWNYMRLFKRVGSFEKVAFRTAAGQIIPGDRTGVRFGTGKLGNVRWCIGKVAVKKMFP